MKRIIIMAMAVLAVLSSCKKVTPEEQIATFFDAASADTTIAQSIAKIKAQCDDAPFGSEANDRLVDFYTLLLAKDAGIDLDDIYTQDDVIGEGEGEEFARNLVAEVRSRKSDGYDILISAPVEDIDASVAAINVLKLHKKLSAGKDHSIRLLLYQKYRRDTLSGFDTFNAASRDKKEQYLLDMDLMSRDSTSAGKTFLIAEPEHIYKQMEEYLLPYFDRYGRYSFEAGDFRASSYPVKYSYYSYKIDPDDLPCDIAAVAGLIYLLD